MIDWPIRLLIFILSIFNLIAIAYQAKYDRRNKMFSILDAIWTLFLIVFEILAQVSSLKTLTVEERRELNTIANTLFLMGATNITIKNTIRFFRRRNHGKLVE